MALPDVLVRGTLDTALACIDEPFTGELVVEKCDDSVRSIDLQLVRVETISAQHRLCSPVRTDSEYGVCWLWCDAVTADGNVREPTEVQNLQIADGVVTPGLTLPIHMVLPRLFTCSSTAAKMLQIDFEVNVIVQMDGGLQMTENIPIKLYHFPRGDALDGLAAL